MRFTTWFGFYRGRVCDSNPDETTGDARIYPAESSESGTNLLRAWTVGAARDVIAQKISQIDRLVSCKLFIRRKIRIAPNRQSGRVILRSTHPSNAGHAGHL